MSSQSSAAAPRPDASIICADIDTILNTIRLRHPHLYLLPLDSQETLIAYEAPTRDNADSLGFSDSDCSVFRRLQDALSGMAYHTSLHRRDAHIPSPYELLATLALKADGRNVEASKSCRKSVRRELENYVSTYNIIDQDYLATDPLTLTNATRGLRDAYQRDAVFTPEFQSHLSLTTKEVYQHLSTLKLEIVYRGQRAESIDNINVDDALRWLLAYRCACLVGYDRSLSQLSSGSAAR